MLNVFNSNAKPLLLQMTSGSAAPPPPPVIWKAGDDLRQDSACLQVFHLMNKLWSDEKLEHREQPVMAFAYGCVPVGENSGFIEFLAGCESLKNIRRVSAHNFDAVAGARDRLVASAAGSFVASYLLGIRDRHYDNILARKDGLIFHIDFGHVLGHTVTVDAAPVAITPALQEVMGDTAWKSFLNVCVRAFAVLRNKHEQLREYIRCVNVCK